MLAARTAGVIEPALLESVRPELEQIRPWPAVFRSALREAVGWPERQKGKNKRDSPSR